MRNATPSLMLVLVLLAALYAATAGRGSGGGAACAAVRPSLEASPAEGAPGEPFSLHGEGFYGNFICDDTGPPVSFSPREAVPPTAYASSSFKARGRGPWRPSPATRAWSSTPERSSSRRMLPPARGS